MIGSFLRYLALYFCPLYLNTCDHLLNALPGTRRAWSIFLEWH